MERRLAAILAADIVNYSRLMDEDEAAALSAIERLREELLEPEVYRWRGVVAKRLGDGWLTEFSSVSDAINCAVQIQKSMAEEPVDLRIGVHVGDIVHSNDDIYGTGVNLASRLEAICQAGFVVASGEAMRLAKGTLNEPFHESGSAMLKNIEDPVQIWSWPKPLSEFAFVGERGGAKPRIFVVPFQSRSDEARDLADAISDDLRTSFSRQSGVVLVTSRELADFLLEGTVRGRGDHWRISVQLTDLDSRSSVWSEWFDELGDDLFSLQDRCVSRVAGAVRVRLPQLLSQKTESQPMESMDVEQLLNRAMNHNFTPSLVSWEESRKALELVLERDAENWMAMTMLCFNRIATGRIFGWRGITQGDAGLAKHMIEQACRIKPADHVVRMVRGTYFLYVERDTHAARLELEESLRLNPIFYHSIDSLSQVELYDGNFEEAKQLADRALDCDSAYPYRHLYHRDAGYADLMLEDFSSALDHFQRADRAAPDLPWNLIGMAVSRLHCGDRDEARRTVASLMEAMPDFSLEQMESLPFQDRVHWNKISSALETLST